MPHLDANAVTVLSGSELDLVSAGAALNLNLSHLVNINVAVPTQVANNVAVLTANISQTIFQNIGVGQST